MFASVLYVDRNWTAALIIATMKKAIYCVNESERIIFKRATKSFWSKTFIKAFEWSREYCQLRMNYALQNIDNIY